MSRFILDSTIISNQTPFHVLKCDGGRILDQHDIFLLIKTSFPMMFWWLCWIFRDILYSGGYVLMDMLIFWCIYNWMF